MLAAQNFFSNNAVDAGGFDSSQPLDVKIVLDVTSATANFGFSDQFVVGSTDGSAPPVVAAPNKLLVQVGQATAISGVSVSEATALAAGQTVTVTLSDKNGLISETANQGTVKGNGTTSLTLTGTVTQVNADLATLSLTDGTIPTDKITITSSDSRTGVGTPVSINVSVNAPPVITVGGPEILSQGIAKAVPGVSISDADNSVSNETFTVTVSDAVGLLSATGTGVSGSGTTKLTITGSLAQVNADLATLMDTEGTPGSDTIKVTANDGRGGVAQNQTIALTISGAPSLTAPTSLVLGQGQTTTISGLSLAEVDTTSGEMFTVTVKDATGIFTDSGAGVSGSGTNSLTITGSLTTVNADLAILKIAEAKAGTDSITINATDTNGGAITPDTIAVTTNGLPVLTAPGSETVGAGHPTRVKVTLAETGNTTGETFTVNLKDSTGLLTAKGTGITGSGTTNLTLTGSLTQIAADLKTLTVKEPSAGSDTITVTATDSLGNSASPVSVAITANPPPSIMAPTKQTLGQGQPASVAVTLAESGATGTETFTVNLTDTTGLLTASGTGVTGSGTNNLTLTGTLSAVTADLATLKLSEASAGSDTLTITASDSLGNKAKAAHVAITTNSPPAITAPSSATLTAGQAGAITGVSLSESGNTTGETFTVKLSDATGLLSAKGKGITGSGTTTLTITGSLATVNADLASLKDTEASPGSDTIQVTASDSFGNVATPASIAVTTNAAAAFTAQMAQLASGSAPAAAWHSPFALAAWGGGVIAHSGPGEAARRPGAVA